MDLKKFLNVGGIDPNTGEEIPEAKIKKQDYSLVVQKIN
jgi:hypothetical protein